MVTGCINRAFRCLPGEQPSIRMLQTQGGMSTFPTPRATPSASGRAKPGLAVTFEASGKALEILFSKRLFSCCVGEAYYTQGHHKAGVECACLPQPKPFVHQSAAQEGFMEEVGLRAS